jgi:acetyl-CoA acetyltransferase
MGERDRRTLEFSGGDSAVDQLRFHRFGVLPRNRNETRDGAARIRRRDQHSILVVGAEQQKTMPPVDGANMLGAAADYHNEKPQYGDFMFPKLFARIAQIHRERYGVTEEQLLVVP